MQKKGYNLVSKLWKSVEKAEICGKSRLSTVRQAAFRRR